MQKTKTKKSSKKKTLKKRAIIRSKSVAPKKSKDMFVTQSMLDKVKSELQSNITSVSLDVKSLEKKMDARFSALDARFSKIDARFASIDARFAMIDERFAKIDERLSEMDSKILKMDSKIEQVLAAIYKNTALMEEQHQRNLYVLDGYTNLYDRQERLEKRMDKFEKEDI